MLLLCGTNTGTGVMTGKIKCALNVAAALWGNPLDTA